MERPKSVTWKKISTVNDNSKLWLEEAINPINNKLIFRLYYDREKLSIILEDIDAGSIKYIFPAEAESKAKAYTLAFKLLIFS